MNTLQPMKAEKKVAMAAAHALAPGEGLKPPEGSHLGKFFGVQLARPMKGVLVKPANSAAELTEQVKAAEMAAERSVPNAEVAEATAGKVNEQNPEVRLTPPEGEGPAAKAVT